VGISIQRALSKGLPESQDSEAAVSWSMPDPVFLEIGKHPVPSAGKKTATDPRFSVVEGPLPTDDPEEVLRATREAPQGGLVILAGIDDAPTLWRG